MGEGQRPTQVPRDGRKERSATEVAPFPSHVFTQKGPKGRAVGIPPFQRGVMRMLAPHPQGVKQTCSSFSFLKRSPQVAKEK